MKFSPTHILIAALPWRIQRMLKIVTDVQENLGWEWLARRVKKAVCVRPAVAEMYGHFPIKTRWARIGGGFEPRYVYEFTNAEAVVENGLLSLDGTTIAESIGDHLNVAVTAVGWRLARPFVRKERLDDNHTYVLLRSDGYFHFVMEPLAQVLYALRVKPEAVVLVDKEGYKGYYRAYVDLLLERGIIKSIQFVNASVISVPHLLLTAAEQDAGMFCRQTIDLLREALLAGEVPQEPSRKIFLTRKGRRQFDNQAGLERIATECGYEVVDTDGLPVKEQIELFRSASHVVSNHGAGLTNLIFSNSGCKVVELFSPKWLNDCYFRLSKICRHEYQCLVARQDKTWGVIDEASFKKMLLVNCQACDRE